MPAIGNIAVNDDQTTPVTHTFAPVTTDGALAKFANRAASTPATYETLSLELQPPSGPNGAYSLLAKMNDPVEATVDGQIVAVRNNSFSLRINFAQTSTSQERIDTLKLAANTLLHATVKSMAQNVEPIY
jgi:hypothetical protein